MGEPRPHAVTVSADQGRTWSPLGELPPQPFGNQIAVHDGTLTTATALEIVGGSRVEPSAPTFWVSDDDGQTFTAHPVTDSAGNPVPPPSGNLVPNPSLGLELATDPIPWVSADPTQKGRFALMIPRDDDFEVYLTEDAGNTWRGPATIPAPEADKPWIDFGAEGQLGVMWRTKAVDVYAAVSCDGSLSFGTPQQINRATQPYASGGGEWSRILFQDEYAYVTWADGRGGGLADGIVGRAPLSHFGCDTHVRDH